MMRLEGEDGEPPWSLTEAAKKVSAKLRTKVSEQMLSRWRKAQVKERRERENFEALISSTTEQLAQHAEAGIKLEEVVDAQILMLIARVHAEEGTEECVKFVGSMTSLKRAITTDRDSKQGIREYEESVGVLRKRIEHLSAELKARGFDPAALDELNKRTVEEIDAMVLSQKSKK